MTSRLLQCTCFLFLAVLVARQVHSQILKTPSDPSEFSLHPVNTTVPAGEQAILKCLVNSHVHVCRWYFIELGLDFFTKSSSPLMVKEFPPAQQRDCSIRFKMVRKIQEGQWMCQAIKFHSSEILATQPVVLKVVTRSESGDWAPPTTTLTTPRQGREHIGKDEKDTSMVRFKSIPEDYIKNTKLEESVELNCKVNKPVTACTWLMPTGVTFNVSHGEEQFRKFDTSDYELKGDLKKGHCSVRVNKVQQQDEGDWRCVVQVVGYDEEFEGPLQHLHITNIPHPSNHSHGGEPLVAPTEGSSSVLVIVLVLTTIILLILVILLFSCLYRRVAAASDETRKILQISPQNSLNRLPKKTLPTTDLTAASVLAVDSVRSSPAKCPPKCVDLDQYNQYLDMTGSDNTSGSYVMMPPSSLRSSTSSRTTLSTLPAGRDRSATNSTILSRASPGPANTLNNPSYDPNSVFDNAPTRPDSFCYADHIYEEIKDKREELDKIEKITEATNPTYTNLMQDYEGYLLPRKDTASVTSLAQPIEDPNNVLTHHTLPRPKAAKASVIPPNIEQAPPYSRVGQCGLVPATPTPDTPAANPGPGYARVGSHESLEDNTLADALERYDVPRSSPQPVPQPPNIPVTSEAYTNGLAGIIV